MSNEISKAFKDLIEAIKIERNAKKKNLSRIESEIDLGILKPMNETDPQRLISQYANISRIIELYGINDMASMRDELRIKKMIEMRAEIMLSEGFDLSNIGNCAIVDNLNRLLGKTPTDRCKKFALTMAEQSSIPDDLSTLIIEIGRLDYGISVSPLSEEDEREIMHEILYRFTKIITSGSVPKDCLIRMFCHESQSNGYIKGIHEADIKTGFEKIFRKEILCETTSIEKLIELKSNIHALELTSLYQIVKNEMTKRFLIVSETTNSVKDAKRYFELTKDPIMLGRWLELITDCDELLEFFRFINIRQYFKLRNAIHAKINQVLINRLNRAREKSTVKEIKCELQIVLEYRRKLEKVRRNYVYGIWQKIIEKDGQVDLFDTDDCQCPLDIDHDDKVLIEEEFFAAWNEAISVLFGKSEQIGAYRVGELWTM